MERDDVTWIEARERGEAGDHPRAAVYARLGQAIAGLPDLPGGDSWKAAVLEELDRSDELGRARAARSRRRGVFAVLGSTLAIAAVAFFAVRPASRSPSVASALTFETGDGAPRRAQGTAAIGQTLTFRGTVAGAGELWIYAGERLVLRCPGADGCAVAAVPGGRRIDASLRTTAALAYTALLVKGPVAAPSGRLFADSEAARAAIVKDAVVDVH